MDTTPTIPLRLTLDPGRGPLIKRGHTLIARLPRCFGIDDGLKAGPRDEENETWNMGQAIVHAYNLHAELVRALSDLLDSEVTADCAGTVSVEHDNPAAVSARAILAKAQA